MSDFQLLCATMHQKDFSLIKKMNINSDVLFANQCDVTNYQCETKGDTKVEVISTCTRGLSNNRNISLITASAEICLLADDDIVYYPDYKNKVLNAFKRFPKADMIIFNMDTNSENRSLPQITKNRKMFFWERNPYGSVRIAFRLKSQQKYNIWFNNILGAGAIYGSGEDSLFVNDFRKKGKVYLCTEVLGKVDFSQSSWFNGYNDKFFFNQGSKAAAIYGKLGYAYIVYYSIRFFRLSNINFSKMISLMLRGYKDYITY